MTNTHPALDPLGPLKVLFFVQGLLLGLAALVGLAWFLGLTWGLYHCSKYFPEGEAKTRWTLLIVFVPVAGALAYCFAGRPSCNRKFF